MRQRGRSEVNGVIFPLDGAHVHVPPMDASNPGDDVLGVKSS
jgi:hypothetical protein